MGTGYTSTASDIVYLLDVASTVDRERVATRVQLQLRMDGRSFRFFTASGGEVSLEEFHRRTQADPEIQRFVYNLWMTYAH